MTDKYATHPSGYPDINGEVIRLKSLLDAIACSLHGWPDDARKTYVPSELPALGARLREKAQRWAVHNDSLRESRSAPLALAREALASARLDGETYCLPEGVHDLAGTTPAAQEMAACVEARRAAGDTVEEVPDEDWPGEKRTKLVITRKE